MGLSALLQEFSASFIGYRSLKMSALVGLEALGFIWWLMVDFLIFSLGVHDF